MHRFLLRPSMIILAIYLMLLGLFVIRHDYKALDFAHLGIVWSKQGPPDSWGYDGQFYYQIAKSPLHAEQFMDNAPYRYRRIGYPMAGYILSLGQDSLVPYALIFLNLAAVVISTELLASLLKMQGYSPYYSLAGGLYFGQAAALTFDTVEAFAHLFVVIGIVMAVRKRTILSAAAFGVAALTRETTLLFPLGYIVYSLMTRKFKDSLLYGLLSVAPLVVWVICIRFIFGDSGLGFVPPFERRPFAGMLFHSDAPRRYWLILFFFLIPTLIAGILAIFELLRGSFHPLLFAWLGNIALFTFLPYLSFFELISSSRVATGVIIGGLGFGILASKKHVLQFMQYHTLAFFVYVVGVILGIDALIL